MTRLSRSAVEELVHQALTARVQLLLGQTGFDELLAVQERVALALAQGAWPWHGADADSGGQALAEAMVRGLGMNPLYYSQSPLDFLISEALACVGLQLADAIAGHERDSRAAWRARVVPALNRIQAFAVSIFDGSGQQPL